MSSDYCRICTSILRDYFGPDVSEIAKPLQWGQKSLMTLATVLNGKYPRHLVQETLIVLLQFNFVSAVCNIHSMQIEYKLNMDNILMVLRYPKYLLVVKRKFGPDYLELVETLLCLGRAPISKVVKECIKMHNKTDEVYNDYWEKSVELIKNEYFKRTATYVVWTEVKQNKLFVPPTKNQKDERQILFVPNFNKFHQDIRNKIIVDAVARTFDDTIVGEVMSTILNQCVDTYAPVSNPISLQLIRNNLSAGQNYLLEYITMIEEDPTNFVCKSYGTMCNVTVNFKQIINCLNDSVIDQIITYKFGESSARLFRATRTNKLLELERLQQIALIPDRETKTLTSELFMNNYLQVQELRKPNTRLGRNDGKSFYLYHLNNRQLHQELTEEILKMIGNCMMWKFKTCEDNKRLLKNKARFDDMVQGLQDKQEADFFEEAMDNLFSPSERILLDSINRLLPVYDHDGNEKTPLYAKNDNEKAVLKFIVGFCMVFCIGLLIVLLIHIHYGSHQLTPHGSVASDNAQCSQFGINMLEIGGNAVDAAITTTLCNSVIFPHLSGLGGSGVMIIYDHRTGIGETIDFRATSSLNPKFGIPGFLAGLFHAHEKFGFLPWKTLVEPSINLAKSGITVTESLHEAIQQYIILELVQDINLKQWLSTISTSPPGQKVKAPNGLINTLNKIALHGPIEFYKEMSKELPGIKIEDVTSYVPFILPTLVRNFMNYTIITSNDGTGGPVLMEVLDMINNETIYDDTFRDLSLLNAFKGFKDDWNENSGLQVSTTDVFDLYVTVISGLGSVFGSRVLTKSGYILNNALELNHKNQTTNQAERVSSLYLPLIAVETGRICGRRLVSGSADVRDGAQILLSMLKTDPQRILSVNSVPRFRFKNNDIAIEKPDSFPEQTRELFEKLGYNVSRAPFPYPTSNIVQKVEDRSFAFSDSRGSGQSVTI